ncbi:ATP-binding protein [Streptomyces sp. NBC_00344]|uniref:ATP-binding protein n=1 Tax=Streptomyces sp. NBC_00344 TaxID=2975720 RepID=UPI002E1DED80
MKQSAAKTLGVALVGAAFAAAAAGSASAATVKATPDLAGTLDTVAGQLPSDSSASTLPAGAGESLAAGRTAMGSTVSQALPTPHMANPASGLLGGLPTGGVTRAALPGLGG